MASELHRQAEIALRNSRNVARWRARYTNAALDSLIDCYPRDLRHIEARWNWYRTQQRLALAKRRLQGR